MINASGGKFENELSDRLYLDDAERVRKEENMILYIDCTSGISGDMLLKALKDLGADISGTESLCSALQQEAGHHPCCGQRGGTHNSAHSHEHSAGGHTHEHSHTHRSHREVKAIIQNSAMPQPIKDTALSIYRVIAAAEARVHGSDEENVHFHEVGRAQAIENIAGIAAALDSLDIEQIYCSDIHDGKGFITCSHGTIPVPVPAVMAMRETCNYTFVTEDIETELVTPSGLGALLGIGAEPVKEQPEGKVLKTAVAKGGRDTGKEGLKVSLIEK